MYSFQLHTHVNLNTMARGANKVSIRWTDVLPDRIRQATYSLQLPGAKCEAGKEPSLLACRSACRRCRGSSLIPPRSLEVVFDLFQLAPDLRQRFCRGPHRIKNFVESILEIIHVRPDVGFEVLALREFWVSPVPPGA
jgi:hypothetical protein